MVTDPQFLCLPVSSMIYSKFVIQLFFMPGGSPMSIASQQQDGNRKVFVEVRVNKILLSSQY